MQTYTMLRDANMLRAEQEWKDQRGRPMNEKQRDRAYRAHALAVQSLARCDPSWLTANPREKARVLKRVVGEVNRRLYGILGMIIASIIAGLIVRIIMQWLEGEFGSGKFRGEIHFAEQMHEWAAESKGDY